MSSTAKFAPTLGGRFWRLQSQVAKPIASASSSMSYSQSQSMGNLSSTKSSPLGNSSFGSNQDCSVGSSSKSARPSGFSSYSSK